MSRSIVRRLIAKDLYLYRWMIVGAAIAGIAALVVTGVHEITGLILFLTSIVALGVFIALYGFLVERKEKSLLFVLSLPVSPMQYTTAKILAALIAFLVPWTLLLVTVLAVNFAFDPPPDGNIPFTIAMMFLFLANFCILIALLLITGSEPWAIAGILVTNFSVPVFMNTVRGLPGIGEHVDGPVAVWSTAILTALGIQAAVIALSLGLAFYVQSRRKDFV
jgi:ABC-type transport system involved in multi-copper enzyme maturation permease subunit